MIFTGFKNSQAKDSISNDGIAVPQAQNFSTDLRASVHQIMRKVSLYEGATNLNFFKFKLFIYIKKK